MRIRIKKRGVVNAYLFAAAIGFLLYALYVAPAGELAHTAQSMMAQATVGISAGVDPNPDNMLAQQLKDKEIQLTEREARIAQIEYALQTPDGRSSDNMLALASLGMSGVLFGLVGYNFYLDRKRGQRGGDLRAGFAVDLKRHNS